MNIEEYLAELVDSSKPLAAAKLANLANLTYPDIALLKAKWPLVGQERRRQIASRLFDMYESNLELNFDNVFEVLLADPDVAVRANAVEALGESEDYHLLSPLIRLLREDKDAALKTAVTKTLAGFAMLAALGKVPSAYSARLEQALAEVISNPSADADLKRRAVEAISPILTPKVKQIIEESYRSPDVKVRASALFAMGRNCDKGWSQFVVAELNSTEPELRYEAARASGELEVKEAVPGLIVLLGDEDLQVQLSAITSLGEIGGKEAKAALQSIAKHSNPAIRQAVEDALANQDFYQKPLSFKA